MYREEVTTKDGHVKVVVADNEQELAEAVAAVKNDEQAVSPDLHHPAEPNAIVSPDNLHTEPAYEQPPEPVVPVSEEPKEAPKKAAPKAKAKK